VTSSPRVEALAEAVAAAAPSAGIELVDAFWAAAARETTPLVETVPGDADGRIVTFLWRGDAHRVIVMVNKLTDPSVLEASSLERVPATDLWHRSFRLHAAHRATYHLAPLSDDPLDASTARGPARRWNGAARHAITDPLNPRTFPGLADAPPLSVLELDQAPPQPAVARRPSVPRGRVSRHHAIDRPVWVYEPPDAGDAPVPVVVLLDGEQWVQRMDAPAIFDNLIADGRMPPSIALMPAALDVATRWAELAADPGFGARIVDELLPWAAERWPISGSASDTTMAGQSIGGLAALLTALRSPDRIGRVIALSASAWWNDGALLTAVDAAPAVPAHVHLEVGTEEWVLLEDHRRLRDRLAARGSAVSYVEYQGGHDAIWWQGGLADGLAQR
jgi:enterochelin esterase family protein